MVYLNRQMAATTLNIGCSPLESRTIWANWVTPSGRNLMRTDYPKRSPLRGVWPTITIPLWFEVVSRGLHMAKSERNPSWRRWSRFGVKASLRARRWLLWHWQMLSIYRQEWGWGASLQHCNSTRELLSTPRITEHYWLLGQLSATCYS